MELIRGVSLLEHRVHADARGRLIALEQPGTLPFVLKRVFSVLVDARHVVRGGHANSCDEFIVALSGSVLIEADNGAERTSVRLRDHDRALWAKAGTLIHLREFEPGTILLVCASATHADTRRFDRPQPHLIGADRPT